MQTIKNSLKKVSSIEFMPLVIGYIILIIFFAIKSDHFLDRKSVV